MMWLPLRQSVEIGGQMNSENRSYGIELVLDLHGCDSSTFTRAHINSYFTEICEIIQMEKCDVHFWDDIGVPLEDRQTLPHTVGTSAVCFILTSTIVIHTLDLLECVYVNIFSCKRFNEHTATEFTAKWFNAKTHNATLVERTLATGDGGI
ncbi:MAG: S-adenosylmethionine decarboxylase [Bryobacterales bacterium]|nr:S-adenosylmethionine decarboxylase [Bryobacterales bacterium]